MIIVDPSYTIFWVSKDAFGINGGCCCSLQTILGKIVQRPAKLDKKLVRDFKTLADVEDPYDTVVGKTMCTNDFYEGQGRLDGAFCDFTENEKMEYLEKLRDFGVVNIEMECTTFAALTHYAGIRAAIVCVTLLDRLKGDQVSAPFFVPLSVSLCLNGNYF